MIYQVCYSYKHKGALFVGYELNGSTFNQTNLKKRPSFWTEILVPSKYRTYSKDYTRSGYDRGHMAPDAAFDYDNKVLKSVYSLVNIVPQIPSLNLLHGQKLKDTHA